MEYYILDNDFNIITGVEKFQSMIWTEKFYDVGDFELYLPASEEAAKFFDEASKNHYYIVAADTTKKENIHKLSVMIIEKVEVEDTFESGDFLIVTGSQLKNLLYRRVVWNRTTIAGQLYSEVRNLILENAITPTISDRVIPRLYLDSEEEIDDNSPLAQTVNYSVEGEFVSKAISSICKDNKIGWDIVLDFTEKKLVFKFLIGTDRTTSQSTNARVLFSASFDNLLKTTYQKDATNYRNIALVKSYYEEYNKEKKQIENKPSDQIVAPYKLGYNPSGLDRYELFVEGENGTIDQDGSEVDVGALDATNQSRGRIELEKYKSTTDISAEVAPNITFKLNKDYFLGDVCSIRNEYNLIYDGRVTAITTTLTTKKYSVIPSFTIENYTGKEDDDEKDSEDDRIMTEDGNYLENESGIIILKSNIKYSRCFTEDSLDIDAENGQNIDITVGSYDDSKYNT